MAGRGTDYSIKMSADIGDLEQKLSKARQSIENFGHNAEVAAKGMTGLFNVQGLDQLATQFSGVEAVVNKLGATFSKTGGSTKQQLRVLQQAATDLTVTFRGLSEAEQQSAEGQALAQYISQLVGKAGELKDAMGDVQREIKNMASDTRMFDVLAGGMQMLATTTQVAGGAMTLFGVEESKVAAIQQKLTSIIAVTNGLTQIQNLLQKESAVMQFINTTRTQGLAVALGVKTAAQVANNAATEAGTVAQLANNAAVLANPYVLAAAAIAALVAGIAIWISSLDEATEAELAAEAATDALTEAMDSEMKKAADQISAFMQLKQTYDQCGGSVDQIKKKIISNTDAQKKAGITVKNLDQATRIFSAEGTKAFINGANARAMAMAAEAATAAQLALVMKELGQALAKVAAGEEVNISDVEEIAKKAGMSADRFKQLARAAGFYEEHVGPFAKNNLRLLDNADAIEAQKELMSSITNYMMNEGTGKVLQELKDAWNVEADINLSAYDDIINSNTDATDKNTNSTNRNTRAKSGNKTASQQSAQSAKDEKTQIEQLDEQYNKLVKTLSTFGKETEQNKGKIEALKKQIRAVLAQKIKILPMNTVGDVDNAIKAMELFLQWCEKDSEEYKKFAELLQKTKITQANAKLSLIDTNTLEGAQAAKQIIEGIVKILPMGSKELEEWSKKLEDASKHARDLQNTVNGIEEGSITDLEQQLAEKKQQRQNKNYSKMERQQLEVEIEDLEVKIDDKKKEGILGEVVVKPKIDVTYDYKKTDLEKIERAYEAHLKYMDDLYESKKKLASTDTTYDNAIEEGLAEGHRLKMLLKEKTILQDIKEYKKNFRELTENATFGIVDGIDSLYSSIDSLSDTLKDKDKNPFEKIMAGIKMLEGAYKTGKDIINTFQEISAVLKTLNGAEEALSGLGVISEVAGADQATQITAQATATVALTTAEGAATTAAQVLAVAQTEMIASSLATVAGLKSLSNAYLELAASEYLAAHASIPFVGYALGAGFATAAKALVMSMQAFQNGGIVGGNRLFGDYQLVRLASGEMVLSGSQQKKLFNLLDGGYSTLRGTNGGEVTFKVKGRDLIAVMNNQNDKMGRIR